MTDGKRHRKETKKERCSESREFVERFNLDLYEGQKDLIEDALKIISGNQIGALESPTGTGKTRSMLLVAMHYTRHTHTAPPGVSPENMALLRDLYSRSQKHVIYACRTHSQIEQVIKELEYLNKAGKMNTKGVVLGSRKQTCINSKVNRTKEINNICRLTVKEKKCVYYNNISKTEGTIENKTEISIEKAVEIGRKCSICPYFYLKKQASTASIVVLPYSILLRRDFFKEFSINSSDAVIIVDEAHNLYGAVLDEHSVQIKYAEIEKIVPLYKEYMDKAKDTYKIELLEVYMVIEGISEYIRKAKENRTETENTSLSNKILNVNRFLLECEIDHINLLDISEIVDKHSLASRIFPVRSTNIDNENEDTLRNIGKLCRLLGECDRTSYIVQGPTGIAFRNIHPAKYLAHLEEIKSILAVGGTIYPCTDISMLFGREIVYKSYPSVCKNIRVSVCTDYLFTYKERSNSLIQAHSLAEDYLLKIPSGGVLVFVQSKDAISQIKDKIRNSPVRKEFSEDCTLFEGDVTLDQYKKQIETKKKIVLFCVMGGNFSEGINFPNELCRVLIVCGIPLPLPTDEVLLVAKYRGNEYFIEKGMQVVNQTIGRAVRCAEDYSCVVLLDKRFQKHRDKISPWIQPYINITDSKTSIGQNVLQLQEWRDKIKP